MVDTSARHEVRATMTGVVSERRRRLRLSPELRREQLIDATAAVIERDGIAAVTMERVAAEASASRSLVYLYFQTRADLLIALLERELTYVRQKTAEVVQGAGSLEEKLLAGFHLFFETMGERGSAFRTILHDPAVDAALEGPRGVRHQAHVAFWAELFAEELGLSAESARLVATMFFAVNEAAGSCWIDGEADLGIIEDLYSRFVLYGLRGFRGT